MPAALPVLLLASWTAVEGLAAATLLGRARQRGGAGGTICEDHFRGSRRRRAGQRVNLAIERPHCDDPGGSVDFRSSLAFERRLARGHQVQVIIWTAAFLLVYETH